MLQVFRAYFIRSWCLTQLERSDTSLKFLPREVLLHFSPRSYSSQIFGYPPTLCSSSSGSCSMYRGQKQPQLRSYSALAAAPLHLESKEYKDRNMYVGDDSKHHNIGDEEENTLRGQFLKENRMFTNRALRNMQHEK